MGYCFMTLEKVKTQAQLRAKFVHNLREKNVLNADPTKKNENEELIPLKRVNGTSVDYSRAVQERMQDLPYYQNHKIRKNGVLAYEVITTFSRDDASEIDLDKWKEENVKWLKETFDVAPDGKSNVISVVYHGDEAGNVHCHAIVVPIDERGKLCASRFTNGSKAMTEMQTDYADSMKQFGLKRGLENSKATHKDIKRYYAELNQAIQFPKPEPGESAHDYRVRLLDELKTAFAANQKKINDEKRKQEEWLTKKRNDEKKAIDLELYRANALLRLEKSKLENDIEQLNTDIDYMERKKEELEKRIRELEAYKQELEDQEEDQENDDFDLDIDDL